jgi:hypothetical protein
MDLTDTQHYKEHAKHVAILSVDLGKEQDYSCWELIETKPQRMKNTRGKWLDVMGVWVKDIVRLPLGTDYATVQEAIHAAFWDKKAWLVDSVTEKPQPPQLLIDAGGPGNPVVDSMSRNLGLKANIISYQLTRGVSQIKWVSKNRFRVPRTVLFQRLYSMLANGQVHADPDLALAPVLSRELKGLRVEANEETGEERITHRESEHDDLAICLAGAAFLATIPPRRARMKLMDSSGSAEINPLTGTLARKGQDLRRRTSPGRVV